MTAEIIPFNRDQLLIDLAELEAGIDCAKCPCSDVCNECPVGQVGEDDASWQARMNAWDDRLHADAVKNGGWPLCRPGRE